MSYELFIATRYLRAKRRTGFISLISYISIAGVAIGEGYIRFHGRNAGTWWGERGDKRYDYEYTKEELRDWMPGVFEMAKKPAAWSSS